MNYIKITFNDIANGPGVRTVLWVAGCEHHCQGCQNPDTWDFQNGYPFDDAAKEQIFKSCDNPYRDGITLSGGDPLNPANISALTDFAAEFKRKFPGKTVWCYTGYLWENVKNAEIMNYIDVLIDGRFMESRYDISLKWRGSSNQRIIDVSKSLKNNAIVLLNINE